MTCFEIQAIDRYGEFITRYVNARDADEAVEKVRDLGFFPTNMFKEDDVEKPDSAKQKHKTGMRIETFSIFSRLAGIKKKDILEFTRKLRTFIQAGIPIYQSLNILQKQTKKRRLARLLKNLADNVEAGRGLAESLARYPKYFSHLYISLINAGEISGNLIEVLQRLETYLDNTLKRKSKLISAAIYPSIVVVMTFGIIALINIVIIPKFKKSYEVLNIELPKITTTVLSTSTWLSAHWYVIIFTPILAFIVIKLLRFNRRVRYITDYILLIIPLIGSINRKGNLSLFYRTLATLLHSGTTIMDALKTSGSVIKNTVIFNEIELITKGIYKGKTMQDMMRRSWLFDLFAVYMVEVGETSGLLDEMLEKTADSYDEELDILYKRLESALEPAIIITLASVVGTVIVALYMPMVKITETLGSIK